MEILSNNRLWSKVLPQKLGYKTFGEARQRNPVTTREEDGEFYVRIFKKDGLMVRVEQEMDWVVKMNKATVSKNSLIENEESGRPDVVN